MTIGEHRKPTEEAYTEGIHTQVTKEDLERLVKCANEMGRTKSDIIRRAVRQYVNKHEKRRQK